MLPMRRVSQLGANGLTQHFLEQLLINPDGLGATATCAEPRAVTARPGIRAGGMRIAVGTCSRCISPALGQMIFAIGLLQPPR